MDGWKCVLKNTYTDKYMYASFFLSLCLSLSLSLSPSLPPCLPDSLPPSPSLLLEATAAPMRLRLSHSISMSPYSLTQQLPHASPPSICSFLPLSPQPNPPTPTSPSFLAFSLSRAAPSACLSACLPALCVCARARAPCVWLYCRMSSMQL